MKQSGGPKDRMPTKDYAHLTGRHEQPEETPDPKTGYICGVAWQHELGEVGMHGPACRVYNSISEAVTHGKCSNECGLVEVEIRLKRWVKPQDLFRRNKQAET